MTKTKIKTIWWVHKDAVLPGSFGGTRHFDFASAIASKNLRFVIIASGFNHFEKKEKVKYKTFFKFEKISDHLTFIWLKTPPYESNGIDRLKNVITFTKRLKQITKKIDKPDLIIGSSPHILSAYASFKIARKLKVPFIFEVRDIWPQALIELGISPFHPMMIYFRWIEKILTKKSKAIIAVMPFIHKYIKEKFNIEQSKVSWISNGVADKYITGFTPRKDNKKFIVTYSGTIGRAQNVENIIYSADILKNKENIFFEIIGDGVEKQKLIRKTKELGLKNVNFLTPLPKDKIIAKLKDSNALILSLKPSDVYQYGNQPNKIFDYLAAGRPIIFSSSAKNNLVREAKCGIYSNPSSKTDLSKKILELYHSSVESQNNMGRNARQFVKQYYSVNKLSKNLKTIIEELTPEL